MSYYKLYRYPAEGNAVRGQLFVCQPLGLTGVGLVHAADTLENLPVMIPALVYPVAVTMSPRFGTLMPLLRMVPNRTGIRIHCGTKPAHSKGCILTPKKAEYKALLERLLYEQNQHEDLRIEIIQLKPGDKMPATIPLKITDYEKVPTQIAPIPSV